MGLKYSILDDIKTKQSGSDMPKDRQIDRCSKQALESLPSGRRKTKLHGLKKSIMWWQREEWKKGSGCIEKNGSWKSENVNGIKKRCVCVFFMYQSWVKICTPKSMMHCRMYIPFSKHTGNTRSASFLTSSFDSLDLNFCISSFRKLPLSSIWTMWQKKILQVWKFQQLVLTGNGKEETLFSLMHLITINTYIKSKGFFFTTITFLLILVVWLLQTQE